MTLFEYFDINYINKLKTHYVRLQLFDMAAFFREREVYLLSDKGFKNTQKFLKNEQIKIREKKIKRIYE